LSDNQHKMKELYGFAQDMIQEAANKAQGFYGKGKNSVRFDEALITHAELEMMDLFQQQLQRRFPNHQVFRGGSLQEDYSHGAERYLWIFDPFDGVANFQAGIPIWGTSLALIENFWPVLGIIALPATGDTFQAIAGHEALWNSRRMNISPITQINDESLLLTYSRFHQHYKTSFPGKIRNLGCTAAHISYVAMGRADAAIIANESFQGLAAARVIVEAAGGKIYQMGGSEFALNEHLGGKPITGHLLVTGTETRKPILTTLQRLT